MRRPILFLGLCGAILPALPAPAQTGDATLAAEVRALGWIAFSAPSADGDWDLLRMRPDGSQKQPLIVSKEFHEAGVRFSPDGKRLLYYRIPKSEPLDNNTYGTFELVIADANGSHPQPVGSQFPWASWGADGRQIACLTPKGIQIVEVEDHRIVRTLPRQGLVQQLVWSPDGKAFTGTANGLGPFWNIGCLADGSGPIRALSETGRFNCTPDWSPDSRHVLYSRGIVGGQAGLAQLWQASVDGGTPTMLWAESQRHIYGACASPDGRYVLFTRSVADLGAVGKSSTTMALIRFADTPMLGDDDPALRDAFPGTRPARWLDLGPGWEPHWTFSEAPANR